MFFLLTGRFKADAEPRASQYMNELNEHLGQIMTHVRLAGELRDRDEHETGFMVLLEAKDFDAAASYLSGSPFVKAGLYDRVEIAHFAIAVGEGQLN